MTQSDGLIAEASRTFNIDGLQPITQGGQKSVLRGWRDGASVVMKVVFLQPPYHEHMLERAHREVGLLSSINSPHVVRVLSPLTLLPAPSTQTIRDAEAAAWLEEELDGQDLAELLGGPWSWDAVRQMLRQLALGLAELHSRRVVHRDLSAGNVRRTANGVWKVLDPGLAKHLSKITITGMFQPGTPGFRTPEHVPGGLTPNPASDVFGLGILAYIALTAQFPVDPSGNEDEYNRRLQEEQCLSVGELRPDLSPPEVQLIDRMLQRQSARRYLDAAEFLDAIDTVS